jgi:hypothetical protein
MRQGTNLIHSEILGSRVAVARCREGELYVALAQLALKIERRHADRPNPSRGGAKTRKNTPMKTAVIAIALALAGSVIVAHAQTPAGTPSSGNAPGRGRGQHRPPSPEKAAEELMKKFDADMDGELSQAELTQALEAIREHRPQGSGGGASQGGHAAKGGNGTPAPGAQGGNQARPSAEQVAAHWIEKFSSDKKGLTVAELAKAIAEHRANHGQHGGALTATPAS